MSKLVSIAGAALGFPASAAWKDEEAGGGGGRKRLGIWQNGEGLEGEIKYEQLQYIDANVSNSLEIYKAPLNSFWDQIRKQKGSFNDEVMVNALTHAITVSLLLPAALLCQLGVKSCTFVAF